MLDMWLALLDPQLFFLPFMFDHLSEAIALMINAKSKWRQENKYMQLLPGPRANVLSTVGRWLQDSPPQYIYEGSVDINQGILVEPRNTDGLAELAGVKSTEHNLGRYVVHDAKLLRKLHETRLALWSVDSNIAGNDKTFKNYLKLYEKHRRRHKQSVDDISQMNKKPTIAKGKQSRQQTEKVVDLAAGSSEEEHHRGRRSDRGSAQDSDNSQKQKKKTASARKSRVNQDSSDRNSNEESDREEPTRKGRQAYGKTRRRLPILAAA